MEADCSHRQVGAETDCFASLRVECERGGNFGFCEEVNLPFKKIFFCVQSLNDFFGASRWEKEGHLSQAACWLVFTRQYSKAVDMLMSSNGMMTKYQNLKYYNLTQFLG